MKKKGNFRKVVSGLLAGMTMLSTVLSPMTAYAAEIQPEEKPPLYEESQDGTVYPCFCGRCFTGGCLYFWNIPAGACADLATPGKL